jgi:hypothetical protein
MPPAESPDQKIDARLPVPPKPQRVQSLAESDAEIASTMRKLSDFSQPLSIEDLNRARQVAARLQILDDMETKISEIAKKRNDRTGVTSNVAASVALPALPQPSLFEAQGAALLPQVVDITGSGNAIVARVSTQGKGVETVRKGSRIANYTVESISIAAGVVVTDGKRQVTLPDATDISGISASGAPVAPAGLIPGR